MINHPNRGKKTAPKTSNTAAPAARRRPAVDHAAHERDYSALLIGARKSFDNATRGQTRLFTTDAADLWDTYLGALPKAHQQLHNCHCCRRFIRKFGGLVAIGAAGETWPVMWNPERVPDFYKPAFAQLAATVAEARVTGVFADKATTWGVPETGEWQHLSVVPAPAFVYENAALTAHQAMAKVRDDVATVQQAMVYYGPKVLDEALRLFKADALDRSEKFVGVVEWFRALHNWPKGLANQTVRHNILWRAVAHAPEGYCHIKSSIIGPLLDDIVNGLPFADIKRKHADKLHPLKYQRPTAAPSAGNVKAAEDLVAKLGIEPSLERRYARLEELPLEDALWTPEVYTRKARPAGAGVFSHIQTKQDRRGDVPSVEMPTQTLTWNKFIRTVLTQQPAEIGMRVPLHGSFFAITTATNADAPPILKWDREEERNPFAVYTYQKPTPADSWKLTAHTFAKVNAIVSRPNMWGSQPAPHLGIGVLLILQGCADTRIGQGNALFPETLRQELHAVRSTIEAYSKSAAFSGYDEASACGYGFGNENINVRLRALIGNSWNDYLIDRWD